MKVYIILGGIISEDGEAKCSEIIGVCLSNEWAKHECYKMSYIDELTINGVKYLAFHRELKMKNDKLLKIDSLIKIRRIVEKEVNLSFLDERQTIKEGEEICQK